MYSSISAKASLHGVQVGADKLKQVAEDMHSGGKVVTAEAANRISSGEVMLTGGRAKGGLAAQAQSAVAKVRTCMAAFPTAAHM